jgi:hypothetical protein
MLDAFLGAMICALPTFTLAFFVIVSALRLLTLIQLGVTRLIFSFVVVAT